MALRRTGERAMMLYRTRAIPSSGAIAMMKDILNSSSGNSTGEIGAGSRVGANLHRARFHTGRWLGISRSDMFADPTSFFAPRSPPSNTILRVVPQQTAYVVERFGRFHRILTPGLHVLIPFVERIAYAHSLKETTIPVPNQTAITKDNVSLTIDGVLYVKVVDPYSASYGVENALYAVTQLAQTSMRSELGKITLDVVFAERDSLNQSIVESIQPAATAWGLQVLRYEIRDVLPPTGVRQAMELQAEAERRKRAQVLESEGQRQAKINIAEGNRAEVILASEASQQDQINRATGEAEAIYRRADATSQGIRLLADSISKAGSSEAISLRIAEQYLEAFSQLAKKGNTILLPANVNNPASMIAQALGVFQSISGPNGPSTAGSRPANEKDPNSLAQSQSKNSERVGKMDKKSATSKKLEQDTVLDIGSDDVTNLSHESNSFTQSGHFSLQKKP